MCPGYEACPRCGNVDRAMIPGFFHRPFELECGARGGVLFGGMVSLIQPCAKRVLRREEPGGMRGNRLEQHHPGREIGRGDDTRTAIRYGLPEIGFVCLPSGRAK